MVRGLLEINKLLIAGSMHVARLVSKLVTSPMSALSCLCVRVGDLLGVHIAFLAGSSFVARLEYELVISQSSDSDEPDTLRLPRERGASPTLRGLGLGLTRICMYVTYTHSQWVKLLTQNALGCFFL